MIDIGLLEAILFSYFTNYSSLHSIRKKRPSEPVESVILTIFNTLKNLTASGIFSEFECEELSDSDSECERFLTMKVSHLKKRHFCFNEVCNDSPPSKKRKESEE